MEEIVLAKQAETAGNAETAAELYEKAFGKTGEDWLAVKAGELYRDAGNLQKGRKIIDRVIGCGNSIIYDRLIRFYFDSGEIKRACDLFLLLFPDAGRGKRIAFADKLLQTGHYRTAEEWYKNCIEGTSYYSYPYLSKTCGGDNEKLGYFARRAIRKGDMYFLTESYKDALAQYAYAAKTSDYAKKKQAECYFMLKDFKKAKSLYRELVQKTDDAYLKFMLAECYNSEDVDVNTFEDALYWYEYAQESGCELVYYHLGLCYQFGRGTEEDLEKAEKMFFEGTKHKIDEGDCYCKLGNLAYMRGDTAKATEYYRKAAKLNNARALLNIAIGYLNKEIRCFRFDEVKCFLAKSSALGSRRAYDLLKELEQ
mgnify:CR=1 FL=1